jgi:SAM-dependent methyltransferase
MISFSHRSYEKELLDGDNIPFKHIRQNMEELDTINHYLGGHKITLAGVKALLKDIPNSSTVQVVEIGSGGGDNLRVITEWARKVKREVRLLGVDYNKECVAYAEGQSKNKGIRFMHSDYKEVQFPEKPDILFSSLFCHHFGDEELVFMLQWMQQNSRVGFFINDLHRHPLAYYSIKSITQLFSKSYLVKNDAPLSVQRGFTRKDWERLFALAGITPYHCQWKWAFRWLVTYLHAHDDHRNNI